MGRCLFEIKKSCLEGQGKEIMEESTKVIIGLIIGGSIGLILAIGFILIAIQFGWVSKFMEWLEDKLF